MEKWADLCFTWEVAQPVSTSDRRGVAFPRFSIVSPRTNGCRGIATFLLLGANQHLQHLRHEWTQKPLWTLAPLTLWANSPEGSLPSLQLRRKVTPCCVMLHLGAVELRKHSLYKASPWNYRVRGTAWETLISSFFWALSQQQNSISPGFLWQHLQKSFPFGSLFPLEGCSHWHSGKDTAGPAPWHVELWECCHCHCVSRNVIMAEQSNYLPPLLSPLITLY